MPSYSGVFTLQAQMQAIAAGTWTGIPLVIGQAYQGGYFAGQISTAGNSIADYNLVVGPVASAQNASKQYRTSSASGDPASVIDGPGNSAAMNDADHPAAQFCEGLTIGGYSDWYMPAINELEVCYFNLKPTTQSNNTSWGINANAVPARASNYTSGNPAQTSATDFRNTGAEDFVNTHYWSSTSGLANSTTASLKYFDTGNQVNYGSKTFATYVRAIRRVAV